MGSASVSRPVHFTGPKKSTVQEGGSKSARRDDGTVVFVVGRDNDEESKEKERKRDQPSCRSARRITSTK